VVLDIIFTFRSIQILRLLSPQSIPTYSSTDVMIGRFSRSIDMNTRASVTFELADPAFTRIGRLAGTRVTERLSVL
jgi:hypothetical protein